MPSYLYVFLALFVVTLIALIFPWPGRRFSVAMRSDAGSGDVLRGQLHEIDEQLAKGQISTTEAEGTRAEIARSLLIDERRQNAETGLSTGGRTGIVLIAVFAFATVPMIYLSQGSPGRSDLPLSARSDVAPTGQPTILSDHEGGNIADAIASLELRLAADPDSTDMLLLLARSYSAVGDYARSAEALKRLNKLSPADPVLMGDYAEALVRASDGMVDSRAVEAFRNVLSLQSDDPRARYYLALADAQAGRSKEAVMGWAAILRAAPGDAPYTPAIRRIMEAVIEDAGLDRAAFDIPDVPEVAGASTLSGPTRDDIEAAANMTPDDQLEMIRGMVSRLASRLEDDPTDVDGWLQLIRSRGVLDEPEQAAAALKRALAANPDDPRLLSLRDQMLGGG